jgi:4-hydroxybenzoate polyprenyltransferase/phosphoserine phosphatase
MKAPLVVDLDGTLTPTDTLIESVVQMVKQSPSKLLRLPFFLLEERSRFKEIVAAHATVAEGLLPYRQALLDYLREEKKTGRRIVLATAAHHSIADKVANHLDLFDQVLATREGHNLKGAAKLQAIREEVGEAFVYAGDSQADLPIWEAAQAAVLVNVPEKLAARVRQTAPVEREFVDGASFSAWPRALRVHQWMKNLLLFVPLLTAFSFMDVDKLISMTLAFLSFSFAASATYIVNDLIDLESDRSHPRKRRRPFASARLPIPQGLAVAAGALCLGLVLAHAVSAGFLLMLLLYVALTSAYAWALKKYVLLDVLLLALLYTLRILAGSVAAGIAMSSWLLAFSVFVFLSLALIKRCAELVLLEQRGLPASSGRDYRVSDLRVLWPLGTGAALASIVVLGLFISAPETQARYGTPVLLWGVALGLIHWLARLWVKTSRGEMHDDPVIYAVKDRASRMTVIALIAVALAAHGLTLDISP